MILVVVLVAAGLAVAVAGISIGPVTVPLSTVWRVIAAKAGLAGDTGTAVEQQIVWDIRVPRVILGLTVGSGLAVGGAVIQAVVRNPLGDPYLLGIAPGASLGAVAAIVLGSAATAGLGLSGAAFVGALGSFAVTLAIARQGPSWQPNRLVLVGVAVGYALSSVTFFLQILATPAQVQRVLFWSLGSVAGGRWSNVALPAVAVLAGTTLLVVLARHIDALVLGDATASSLGLDVGRVQALLVAAASLLTGALVAVAGGIGFVGLIVPHVARLLVGAAHRRVLVAGVLLGGPFLVLVDIAARMVRQPAEIPIGIVTAAIGAPTFLVMIRAKRPGAA
jgi:iron complex transport system permease protein